MTPRDMVEQAQCVTKGLLNIEKCVQGHGGREVNEHCSGWKWRKIKADILTKY